MNKKDLSNAYEWFKRNDFNPFFADNETLFIIVKNHKISVSNDEILYRSEKEFEYKKNLFEYLAK
jgi:hypothetical protein